MSNTDSESDTKHNSEDDESSDHEHSQKKPQTNVTVKTTSCVNNDVDSEDEDEDEDDDHDDGHDDSEDDSDENGEAHQNESASSCTLPQQLGEPTKECCNEEEEEDEKEETHHTNPENTSVSCDTNQASDDDENDVDDDDASSTASHNNQWPSSGEISLGEIMNLGNQPTTLLTLSVPDSGNYLFFFSGSFRCPSTTLLEIGLQQQSINERNTSLRRASAHENDYMCIQTQKKFTLVKDEAVQVRLFSFAPNVYLTGATLNYLRVA